MTLLAPWFLAGLAALVPLVALHLRRRRRRREVDSLLLWRQQPAGAPGQRRPSLVLSLPLVLQAVILALIVLALARPLGSGDEGSKTGRPTQVFVLDGSIRMSGSDGANDRLTAARAELDRRLARLPSGTPVSIVVAGAAPRLLVADASPRAARDALASVRTTAPTADLRAGLALADGQLRGEGSTVTLVRAVEDEAPRVATDGVHFSEVAIGERAENQAIEPPVARCEGGGFGATAGGEGDEAGGESGSSGGGAGGEGGAGTGGGAARGEGSAADPGAGAAGGSSGADGEGGVAQRCSVFAAVRNEGARSVRERLVVERAGRIVASQTLTIEAGGRADVAFDAAPGARLTLRLDGGGDALAADDRATVTVPDAGAPVPVTLVSARPATAPLARALATAPGVVLRLVPPSAYTARDTRDADLVVLDRWMPDGGLPDAPALLLVDPPRLPGGHVSGALADPELSGQDAADPLLSGVDLSGLAISADAARRIALPPSLWAAAWSPGGPLVAAGAQGEAARRVALLAFDPERSTLVDQPAFPILIANVVAWASGRPEAGGVAMGASPSASGSGGGGSAGGSGAGSAAATEPVTLRAGDGGGAAPSQRRDWWPWLIAAALIVLLAEWSYPRWPRRGAVDA